MSELEDLVWTGKKATTGIKFGLEPRAKMMSGLVATVIRVWVQLHHGHRGQNLDKSCNGAEVEGLAWTSKMLNVRMKFGVT